MRTQFTTFTSKRLDIYFARKRRHSFIVILISGIYVLSIQMFLLRIVIFIEELNSY